jgi:hypothetical protein
MNNFIDKLLDPLSLSQTKENEVNFKSKSEKIGYIIASFAIGILSLGTIHGVYALSKWVWLNNTAIPHGTSYNQLPSSSSTDELNDDQIENTSAIPAGKFLPGEPNSLFEEPKDTKETSHGASKGIAENSLNVSFELNDDEIENTYIQISKLFSDGSFFRDKDNKLIFNIKNSKIPTLKNKYPDFLNFVKTQTFVRFDGNTRTQITFNSESALARFYHSHINKVSAAVEFFPEELNRLFEES